MAIDPKILSKVSNQVYRQFPEMEGVKPKSRQQQAASGSAHTAKAAPSTYLVTYQTNVRLGEGKSIARWVRVVVNAQGSILKITTSR